MSAPVGLRRVGRAAARALFLGGLGAALAAVPAAVRAQSADTIAFPSPRGTYVWMKGTVVSPAHPVDGVVAHRLERSRPGGDWEKVADVSAVPDARSFFSRLDSLTRRAVVGALRQKDEAAAWDYIVRFPGADSLAAVLGNDDVRLALGVYGLDPSPRDGETWRYRVSDVDADGNVSNPVMSNAVSFPPEVRFDTVTSARSQGADSATITWWYVGDRRTRAKTVEVWRREGRTGEFAMVDSVPVSVLAGDSLLARSEDRDVVPGALYQYYAVPRDLFFNRGRPSDTISVYTVPLAGALLPDSIVARGVDTLGVVLTWRLETPDKIRTIQVFRSPTQDTGYVQVAELPPTATSWVDAEVRPMRTYWYRLGMTGLRGVVAPRSAAVFAYFRPALAPSPPLAVRADTAAAGFRIRWVSAGDADLAGYRVYRTDAPAEAVSDSVRPTLVSPLLPPSDTVFVDSASDLAAARRYTWAVKAVGPGGLESEFSNPASASRTVTPPLPVPTGLSGYADEQGARLTWDDMTAADPLVNGYLVLRRDAGGGRAVGAGAGGRAGAGAPDAAWDTLTAVPLGRQENRYRDTTAVRGAWTYAVVSVGVTGERSDVSAPLPLSWMPPPPPPPSGFRAQAVPEGVRVSWDPAADSAATVRIYRYERGGEAARIGEVPSGDLGYLDRTARLGRRYYYFLTTLADGVEGPHSVERSARK
ncbi:MAG TPA: hypothetical protein VKB18_05285 [Gemmatimonadota bacterium]|nr:hypothetical protein [Gemmatimonadota bacterium]